MSRRGGSGLMSLAQSLDDSGTEAEGRLCQTPEHVIKIDQSRMGGITQQACGTGDAQAKGLGNLATPFFIQDQ